MHWSPFRDGAPHARSGGGEPPPLPHLERTTSGSWGIAAILHEIGLSNPRLVATNSLEVAMKGIACALCLVLLVCGSARAADGFDKVLCGSDIPKALIGQRSPNGKVVAIEGRHKDLSLKHLGSEEISDNLWTTYWSICGSEFVILDDGRIRDVLPFPPHSKDAPAFGGTCQANGKDLPDAIVAVLSLTPGKEPLPASAAWKIDTKRVKFVSISTDGLTCPRNGIFTVDGGL
jgi:hypothetical protein